MAESEDEAGPALPVIENTQLLITDYENGVATVDATRLNGYNVYHGITSTVTAELPPPSDQIGDLIIVVNADNTLSLFSETLDAIMGSPGPLLGPKFFRKLPDSGDLGPELSADECSEFFTKIPLGMAVSQPNIETAEISELFQMNPEELERLESALFSDQAKQILGEKVSAMLDILSVEGDDGSRSRTTRVHRAQADIVRQDHNYAFPSSSAIPQTNEIIPINLLSQITGPWAFNINERKNRVLSSGNSQMDEALAEESQDISLPAVVETVHKNLEDPVEMNDVPTNITEAMLDEKFRQELLDKDDYAHSSGKSSDNRSDSDSDLKIVLSPKKDAKSKKMLVGNRKPVKGKPLFDFAPMGAEITENKALKAADVKPKETLPILEKKSYPKRVNRRLPDRLKDSAEPALFSLPDVMNRFDAEKVSSSMGIAPEGAFDNVIPACTEPAAYEQRASLASESVIVSSASKFLLESDHKEGQGVLVEKIFQAASGELGKHVIGHVYSAKTNDSVLIAPEVIPSKRIRKRKISFGEMDDIKPKPRAKPRAKPKGKAAQGNRTKTTSMKPNDSNTDENEEEGTTDDASWNSEDDPDRLWCICRKPHNNRFMICCDVCEDWFHGHCVGVSKAMGKAMEDQGREWTCPACKKKKTEPVPFGSRVPFKDDSHKFHADTSVEKPMGGWKEAKPASNAAGGERPVESWKHAKPASNAAGSWKLAKPASNAAGGDRPVESNPKPATEAQNESSQENVTFCIVCKMRARSNSIYCSDNCILRHASTSTPISKNDSLNSAVSSNVLRPNNPASKPSSESKILAKGDQSLSKSVRLVKIASIPAAGTSSHAVKKPSITATKISQSMSRTTESFYQKGKSAVVIKPKQVTVTPVSSSKQNPKKRMSISGASGQSDSKATPSSKTIGSKSKEKLISKRVDGNRRSSADVKSSEMQSPDAEKGGGTEPIRITVRDTLHGLLLARLQECQDALKDIKDEEVKKIGHDIEEELYAYFKEAGSKYKSKYRSLVFNIRDPTNLTLFRKIADKSVTPYQLVRLSPEELASQQLAQWRERESKHQIEMIKKNELDLLALSKSVVMKSHKGEHVIDSSDIQNQTVLEFDIDHPDSFTQSSVTSTVSDGSSETKEKPKSYLDRKKSSRSSSKHKSKSRSRDDKRDDRSRHKKSSRHRDSSHRKSSTSSSKPLPDKVKPEVLISVVKKDIDEVMDPLIETSSTVPSAESSIKPLEHQVKDEITKLEDANSDREPTSTVPDVTSDTSSFEKSNYIATEWTGFVSMQDVAKFSTSIQVISGAPLTTCKDLPPTIDIIGRIDPDTVWQYISKMKRSGTKEIIVVRLNAGNNEEMVRYTLLYTYLNSRNRLGVVGSLPKSIKDFYVLPLSSGSPLPQVLLPLDGPGFADTRPHLLLGVIVRPRRKRLYSAKVSRADLSMRSYTPPPSGMTLPMKSLFGGSAAYKSLRKESKKIKVSYEKKKELIPDADDGDEPYSPGDSDASDLDDILSAPQSDLKRRMDLINKQIAEQKQQIENISSAIVGDPSPGDSTHDSNEAYSPSASFTPPHRTSFPFLDSAKAGVLPNIPTDISLPANIQEILANIKKQSDSKLDLKMDPIVQNYGSKNDDQKANKPAIVSYTPTAIKSTKAFDSKAVAPVKSRDPRTQEAPKPSSTLSKLSDAELLEMAAEQAVPSDAHPYGMPPPGVDGISGPFISYPPGQHNYAMNPTNNFLPSPHHTNQIPLQIPLSMPPPGMNPNVPPPGYLGASFGMPFPGPNFLGPPPNVGFEPPFAGPPRQQPTARFGRHDGIGRGDRGGGNRFRGRGDPNQRRDRSRWNQRDISPRRVSRPRRDSNDRSRSSRDSKTSASRSSKSDRRRRSRSRSHSRSRSRDRDSDSS